MANYTDAYQGGARRYDMGERASFSNIAGGLEAIRLINEWGLERICDTITGINRDIAVIARDSGLRVQDEVARAPHFPVHPHGWARYP